MIMIPIFALKLLPFIFQNLLFNVRTVINTNSLIMIIIITIVNITILFIIYFMHFEDQRRNLMLLHFSTSKLKKEMMKKIQKMKITLLQRLYQAHYCCCQHYHHYTISLLLFLLRFLLVLPFLSFLFCLLLPSFSPFYSYQNNSYDISINDYKY